MLEMWLGPVPYILGELRDNTASFRWKKNYPGIFRDLIRVSVQGVESLWGDCRFIPADWGS